MQEPALSFEDIAPRLLTLMDLTPKPRRRAPWLARSHAVLPCPAQGAREAGGRPHDFGIGGTGARPADRAAISETDDI